jgi:hypothetical protein
MQTDLNELELVAGRMGLLEVELDEGRKYLQVDERRLGVECVQKWIEQDIDIVIDAAVLAEDPDAGDLCADVLDLVDALADVPEDRLELPHLSPSTTKRFWIQSWDSGKLAENRFFID